MSRTRFFFVGIATVIIAVALAACGGGSSSDPQTVLEGATFKGVESANVNATIKVAASGQEGGNIEVKLSGPFESVEGGSYPKLDMTASATGTMGGKNVDFEGGLLLLPTSAYVNYKGTEYEVDPTTFSFIESTLKQAQQQGEGESKSGGSPACKKAAEELSVSSFLENLSNEGEAEVGGTGTTKISGDLDIAKAIEGALKLYENPACSSQLSAAGSLPSTAQLRASKEKVSSAVKSAHVDVYVGSDHIVRRVAGKLTVEPQGGGGGPSSATLEFDVSLEGVNEEQEFPTPQNAKPLNDLFQKLGVNPLELLGALQGEGAGLQNLFKGLGQGAIGGSGGAGSGGGGRQAYFHCLQEASSTSDLEKCATEF